MQAFTIWDGSAPKPETLTFEKHQYQLGVIMVHVGVISMYLLGGKLKLSRQGMNKEKDENSYAGVSNSSLITRHQGRGWNTGCLLGINTNERKEGMQRWAEGKVRVPFFTGSERLSLSNLLNAGYCCLGKEQTLGKVVCYR